MRYVDEKLFFGEVAFRGTRVFQFNTENPALRFDCIVYFNYVA